MPPPIVDRRAVTAGLGAGGLATTLGWGASHAPMAQTWMRIDAVSGESKHPNLASNVGNIASSPACGGGGPEGWRGRAGSQRFAESVFSSNALAHTPRPKDSASGMPPPACRPPPPRAVEDADNAYDWQAVFRTAHRLGVDAVTVDGSRLSLGAFAERLGRLVPVARQAGLDVHADLGDRATPWRPQAGAGLDYPPFARTPHHRLSDPLADGLREHLDGLLGIAGLAGLQMAFRKTDLAALGGLIRDHVVAPARLRGKVVTARIDAGPAPQAWALDAMFRTVFSGAGYTLLRQVA